ncbi:hypothetical protein DM01DRAFT_1386182 [Hesseltinella vesiculosa]|uniref:Peptide hydrolase n=1 Tax=Hesseltinella vesiculosa TaxID=101127 RepID=A0A1X2G6T2_9FUNG|nr:hypothetical protein DM01DRAFT_1386182 [Hesseltinella vesiculosa]
MAPPPTESTPLLRTHGSLERGHAQPLERGMASAKCYLWTLIALAVFLWGIYDCRSVLPRALSDVEAQDQQDFAGLHAYNDYLTKFNMPHSGNQIGNQDIYLWIADQVEQLAAIAKQNDITVDVIAKDNTTLVTKSYRLVADEYLFLESRNVLFRLHGKSGSLEDAFLVDAHYDGVSTSHGVTDNGMGVATALELARYFASHPPEQTIIFLFNNLEENGLYGAQLFANHPWFPTVKLFLDLEGTGSGGRATLFRSTNLAAVKALANSGARYLHATPFGNDMLKSSLIRSDTDFTVYTKYGIPGLDIAFYNPRANYHTQNDDLAHTTPSSLQHMGHMALHLMRKVDATPSLVHDATSDRFIYFDILGHSMLVYSFTLSQIINITSLVLVPLVWLGWFALHLRQAENKRHAAVRSFLTLGQGVLAVLMAGLFIIALNALFIFALLQLKPFATYGNMYMVAFGILVASLTGLALSQLVLSRIEIVHEGLLDQHTSLYGLAVLAWGLTVWATVLNEQQLASGYVSIYLLASIVASLVFSHGFQWWLKTYPSTWPSVTHLRGPVVMILELALPTILLADICLLSMDALRHVSPDGTPELSVYMVVAVPIGMFALLLLPWVHLSRDKLQPLLVLLVALLLVFISCLAVSPYNADGSPNRILFTQFVNVSQKVSTVELISGQGLDSVLQKYLPSSQAAGLDCQDFSNGFQRKCVYETAQWPRYAQDPDEFDLEVTKVKSEKGGKTHARVSLTVQHSQFCHLKTNAVLEEAKFRGSVMAFDQDNVNRQYVSAYVDERGVPQDWEMVWQDGAEPTWVQASCLYDDWTDGQMPAFTTLRDRLPQAQALTMRGGIGLTVVLYPPVFV